jgi:hypothetical protein
METEISLAGSFTWKPRSLLLAVLHGNRDLSQHSGTKRQKEQQMVQRPKEKLNENKLK